MTNFIKLITEKIGDNLYAWNLECSDMELLKDNFNDKRHLGITIEYVELDEPIICLYDSINPHKQSLYNQHTTHQIINEFELKQIEKLVKRTNNKYKKEVQKGDTNSIYYYISETFEVVKAKGDSEKTTKLYEAGNYFLIEDLANIYRDKILQIFKTKTRIK